MIKISENDKWYWIAELFIIVISIIYMLRLNSYNHHILNAIDISDFGVETSLKIIAFQNYYTYLLFGIANILAILLYIWFLKSRCLLLSFILICIINIIIIIAIWKLLWIPIVKALIIFICASFSALIFQD